MSQQWKWFCSECKENFYLDSDALRAKNPFNQSEEIVGCPNCFAVNSRVEACQHGHCWMEASCGTPTKDGGYARTCGRHCPIYGDNL